MPLSIHSRSLRCTSVAAAAALVLSTVTGIGGLGHQPAAHASAPPQPTVVTFASEASDSWTVPAGVTEIRVNAIGGRGGDTYSHLAHPSNNRTYGARGGSVSGTMSVTPGEVIHVRVGGDGGRADMYNGGNAPIPGGANGGRPGVPTYGSPASGSGGASDIRVGGTTLSHRILVAGGGGGNAAWMPGGAAGQPGRMFDRTTGSASVMCDNTTVAGAGTTTGGGAGATATACTGGSQLLPGEAGTLGHGGDGGGPTTAAGYSLPGGAPGGGGYYGGGGGTSWIYASGAGGSNYVSPTLRNPSEGIAAQTADPSVTITYLPTISEIVLDPIAPIAADGQIATIRFTVLGPNGPVATAAPEMELTSGTIHSGPTHQGDGVFTARIAAPLAPATGKVTLSALGVSTTADLTFTQRSQSITTAELPDVPTYVNTSWSHHAAGTSGLPVTVNPSGACVRDAGTVRFIQSGTCTVSFTQPGDTIWAPAMAEVRTITVVRRPQVITFAPAPSGLVGETVELEAIGGGSGMPVTYTARGTCALASTTVRLTEAGDCIVTVVQDGSDEYEAAAPITATIAVSRNTTSIVLGTPAPITHGQDLVVRAAVPGGVAGQVQFLVDGDAIGSPVTVADGEAEQRVSSLAAGAHRIGATFTPSDEVTHLPATAHDVTATVAQAGTTSTVVVSARNLTATVTSDEAGTGHPTGTVEFHVDGSVVGTATLIDGVATLKYSVDASERRSLAVTYAGDRNFLGSSASTVRENPTITAALSAAPNRAGWHARPVVVTFTCAPGSAPLTRPCPAPVRVSDAKAKSVTATVRAADGGVATASVAGINVDTVAPKVKIKGVRAGRAYTSKPKAVCKGSDRGAGVATCTVTTKVKGTKIVAKAVATDHAGHRSRVKVVARLDRLHLLGVRMRNGAYPVKTGAVAYTLVMHSAKRPTYLAAAKSPKMPTARVMKFRKVGPNRWALGVRFEPAMRHTRYWNIGAQVGKKKVAIRVRVRN